VKEYFLPLSIKAMEEIPGILNKKNKLKTEKMKNKIKAPASLQKKRQGSIQKYQPGFSVVD
jgi:hypothetical protein